MQSKWAPPGTQLTTITSLRDFQVDDKVRFFGVVQRYNADSAILLLTAHETAATQLEPQTLRNGTVAVDISVPLAETTHDQVAVGTRLIVIGHVVTCPTDDQAKPRRESPAERELRKAGVHVKALSLQDAGRTQSAEWDVAVGVRRDAMKAMKQAIGKLRRTDQAH